MDLTSGAKGEWIWLLSNPWKVSIFPSPVPIHSDGSYDWMTVLSSPLLVPLAPVVSTML